MSRHTGLGSLLRAAARASRAMEASQRRSIRMMEVEVRRRARESLRAAAAAKRYQAQAEREARAQYIESRMVEVNDSNEALSALNTQLTNILADSKDCSEEELFEGLRIRPETSVFSPPKELLAKRPEPLLATFESQVPELTFMRGLVPGAKSKHSAALGKARESFDIAHEVWEREEKLRATILQDLRSSYEAAKAAAELKRQQQDAEVQSFRDAFAAQEANAVGSYHELVLDRSEYPEGVPEECRAVYVPESRQLVQEIQLPGFGIVPAIAEYKYVKSKDEISERPRKRSEMTELYQDIICAIALRTIREAFVADRRKFIDTVCFNGYIDTVDSATGQNIRPHVISVRVTRGDFEKINLAKVDKKICLRNLGAQISPRPAEAQPVKPIIEFDMVDKRFVEQGDVLESLESRPNLMDLNPFQFETLVANLFGKMGLESKLTRSSKDGGVDCVAFDPRPVLGGKVVIQAKRYRHTVGVSAVRDLYGTMMNEGANKGILVATSGYGPDAFEFCKDKPIELIDGGGLLYLLAQTGVKARIVMPTE